MSGAPDTDQTWQRARVPCVVDISATDFYSFTINMRTTIGDSKMLMAGFGGIHFP